jgi:rhodanese-related sulfurtransferase
VTIPSIDPSELRQRLDRGDALRLVDVRELPEWEICRLPGAELKPMSEILSWQDELEDEEREVVIYCHHGVRSLRVCGYLLSMGRRRLVNLRGGIEAWRRTVDPSMPGY